MLRALWQRGDATVRELMAEPAICGAYTTLMTTIDMKMIAKARMMISGLLEILNAG